jgi:hypothetical protein
MWCFVVGEVFSVHMKFLEPIKQLHNFLDQRTDSFGKTYGNIKYHK